ncbi:MAG: hypothetical protein KKA42_00920 [candidate division Zixibacteria bacterium]|nr:hypothetical protein [candidate division Zixibacteria bacterium]
MRIVIFIIAVVLLLLALFTVANWSVLTASTPLSFLLFSVEGPLGVILLAVLFGLVLLMTGYAFLLRTSWLVESRRVNRQLDEQRELAQQAEKSRVAALQEMIEREFRELRTTIETSTTTSVDRISTAEQKLASSIEEAANGITANLGYLDDKLKGNSQA